ncbi:uncharacterized protein TM35_000361980 [Trypanosoma theileri]|uniref:Uncharacterized protein n=1 Tax=Trypanosoma theileri TaxID=67003 RepID=A0A1X0NLD6_9TRYP|nr:uncharacterized protein TM35_000361980 [Trypanosoma theileri]ORC85338.1 hypothetical protein TM35_000361980 [Trypanosoma theileri]
MRLTSFLRCPAAGSTLTARLSQLALRVETLYPYKRTEIHTPPKEEDDGSLWKDVVAVAGAAGEARETDTAMALVLRLLHYSKSSPPAGVWATLIRDLAPYGDVEANTVLTYPGVISNGYSHSSHTSAERSQYRRLSMERSGTGIESGGVGGNIEEGPVDSGILLRPTRETLLLTGGVVPLSARAPCSDGGALANLLNAFCSSYEASSSDESISLSVVKDVMDAVVSTLRLIAPTVVLTESSSVTRSLLRFFQLVFRPGKQEKEEEKKKEQQKLAEELAIHLIKVLPINAVGARVVILFLAEQHKSFPDDMIHLPLVRIAVKGLWLNYESVDDFSCLQHLQQVNDAVDVTLQRNANSGNSLGLEEADESDIRLLLSLALLRLMRLQADSPDIFLRDAVDIVDRCPVNLSVEYELLAAKVQLLDLFIDDPESSNTIYDDLLQSLRALVELRPRDNSIQQEEELLEEKGGGGEEEEEIRRITQFHFQEAHRLVVTAFAQSHVEERLNQAYTILVTHKYHGLIITRELMHPLMDVLSRRGDCRVFNIVDLCVLYSGNSIDYETLNYLFQSCRVAGDFYRARTLYQLLREMIPGFLLRAPESIKEALRGLKVLEPEPNHLFPSSFTVERDVDATVAAAAVASAGVVDDEMLGVQQRGPIRELPNVVKETSSKDAHTSQ